MISRVMTKKTVTIGRTQGDQPFEIKQNQSAVSGKHAVITIDTAGNWMIEDAWSTNGTFIRDESGRFRKVGDKNNPGKCGITPQTFVFLGLDPAKGCGFFAKQGLEYGDFDEDFEIIKAKNESLSLRGKSRSKNVKLKRWVIRLLPITFVGVWIIYDYLTKGYVSPDSTIWKFLLPGFANPTIELLLNSQEKKKSIEKTIKEERKNFSFCPNPSCNHVLSDKEIELMKCDSCKIEHS